MITTPKPELLKGKIIGGECHLQWKKGDLFLVSVGGNNLTLRKKLSNLNKAIAHLFVNM